jgi:transcription antitermination factor NusG
MTMLGDIYQWFAIHTKYKCEKFVREQLLSKGIEAYVPVLLSKKHYLRKVKTYEKPLINCYAFVHISNKEYKQILQTPYVYGFVKSGNKINPIPKDEMLIMQRVVGDQKAITFEPKEWNQGDSVEVIGGNLTGLKGILLRRNGKSEFVIELLTIGFQMHMLIEDKYLRKVSHARLSV